jgi:thiol-disulfide isomerase/thioredoxin
LIIELVRANFSKKFIPLFCLLLILGLLASGCASSLMLTSASDETPTGGIQVGKPAPYFTLLDLNGQPVSLSSLGKPVFVNFWATWCPPCRYEMPFIQEIHEEWANNAFVVLAVNVGENRSTVSAFVQDNDYSFSVLLDTDQRVALEYGIRMFPTTIFIDKDGIVQNIKVGAFLTKAEIERNLRKIIT